MKYESEIKKARNYEIREFHRAHPELTYRELGKQFSISGARAFKLCKPNVTIILSPVDIKEILDGNYTCILNKIKENR